MLFFVENGNIHTLKLLSERRYHLPFKFLHSVNNGDYNEVRCSPKILYKLKHYNRTEERPSDRLANTTPTRRINALYCCLGLKAKSMSVLCCMLQNKAML